MIDKQLQAPLCPACSERDAKIAELEKERDALIIQQDIAWHFRMVLVQISSGSADPIYLNRLAREGLDKYPLRDK